MSELPSELAFPVRPYVRKYLVRHLGEHYVLSRADRFGLFLFHLLRKQGRGAKKTGGKEKCSATFAIDLRNFPFRQYGLEELTSYSIFHFNEFVDELLKGELYMWVRAHATAARHRTTVKDAIVDFMVLYDLREEDISFETLRKSVQRNTDVRPRKRDKSVVKPSQKSDPLSQKSGVMSQTQQLQALRQHLKGLPLPLFDLIPPSARA